MSKDCRITVRMSEELGAWVHAQACAREMDDAAFVRMLLAESKSGAVATRIKVEAPLMVMQPQPVQRDVLEVSSGVSDADFPHPGPPPQVGEGKEGSIDIDDLVAASLEEAEAAGLTQPQIEAAQGEMPEAGVRPLFRRPIPFSRGTQHARLEQMFGGN